MLDPVEQIKERLPIYDLVSQYVELKRAGRNFKGLCPFHGEKTPSFVVSPEKGLAYCFGCNRGGDVLAFYQLVEGCDFAEALKNLADKVGVELAKESEKVDRVKVKNRKQDLIKMHKIAVEYFVEQLHNSSEGKKVQLYLEKRGLTPELISKFKLGYASNDNQALTNRLLKENYDYAELSGSGLILAGDTVGRDCRDRFRQRLMIPITNLKGEIVAFGGRALAKDLDPKYLNSPETDIYHKSQTLFGLDLAKDAMRKQQMVYVVEGYFDVMALHAVGVENVVATCGTAMTEQHLQLLKRFVNRVVLAFDADSAGQAALIKAAAAALGLDLSVAVLSWGDGKDPADLLQESPDKLKTTVLGKEIDLIDYVWRNDFKDQLPDVLESSQFLTQILEKYLPLLQSVRNEVALDLFIRKLSQFLRTEPKFLYAELKKSKDAVLNRPKNLLQPQEKQESFEHGLNYEELFWAHFFVAPKLLSDVLPLLPNWAEAFKLNAVYKQVFAFYNDGRNLEEFNVSVLDLPEPLKDRLDQIGLYLESRNVELWTYDQLLNETKLLLDRIVKGYREQRMSRLKSEIAEAEHNRDQDKLKELLKTYNDFILVN